MSVHPNRVGGYDVRYRDATGKHRSKTFRRRRDADRFDQQVKDAKQTGSLARDGARLGARAKGLRSTIGHGPNMAAGRGLG